MRRFLVVAVGAIVLASCGEIPAYRIPSLADVTFSWDGNLGGEALPSPNGLPSTTSRGLIGFDYGGKTPPFEALYDSFGSLIGSYTPTRFELGLLEIDIRNHHGLSILKVDPITEYLHGGQEPSRDLLMADFVNENVFTPYSQPNADTYHQVSFIFTDYVYDGGIAWAGGVTEPWDSAMFSAIEVQLPGYTDTELGNVIDRFATNAGTEQEYFVREYLGESTFRFTWNSLSPLHDWFRIFFDSALDFQAYIENDPVWDRPLSELGLPGGDMVFPFESFELESGDPVRIVVSWDVNNILEVYDNNTPGDKTDDLVILRRGFWEGLDISLRE